VILDIGCGRRKATGAIGLDASPLSDADVIGALDRIPWPLRAASVDEIRAIHIVEHLSDLVAVMREMHRVCRPGGRVVIETPYFSSHKSWADPTHIHHLTLGSLDYFLHEQQRFGFAYTQPLFRLLEKRLSFGKNFWSLPPRIIYRLSPRIYEERFAFLFPGRTLHFTLERLA
jgi:SAM-dependent methyltransferase